MDAIVFNGHERVMVLCPHPDDETLAAGGLLQRAARSGARVQVVYATRGDNNPWMQRLHEKRWRLGPSDRDRYAAKRGDEAVAALAKLGVRGEDRVRLDFPDQGLTRLLVERPRTILESLTARVAQFEPDCLVFPSALDWHPDHSALSVLTRLALDALPQERRPNLTWSYLCHGRTRLPSWTKLASLALNPREMELKRQALDCHRTQVAFRRGWYHSVLKDEESFIVGEDERTHCLRRPLCHVRFDKEDACLALTPRARLGAWGAVTLRLISSAPGAGIRSLAMDLDWDRKSVAIRSEPDGERLGQARLEARRDGGTVRLPRAILGDAQRLWAKVERRHGFFDEAGWMEIEPVPPALRQRANAVAQLASDAASSCAGAGATDAGAPAMLPAAAPGVAPYACAIVPCYNVVNACVPIARETLQCVEHLILVDDGSTDGTGEALQAVVQEAGGRASLISLPANQGKGHALFAGFRHALEALPFDVLIVLDGDGQHRPQDIPALIDAWRQGGEMVMGERFQYDPSTPWRSRVGNQWFTRLLRRVYPNCPTDTQTGFRLMERAFVAEAIERIASSRYETELSMLLLALRMGVEIRSIEIPAIYHDRNRSSHFRPIVDSCRIVVTLLRWICTTT